MITKATHSRWPSAAGRRVAALVTVLVALGSTAAQESRAGATIDRVDPPGGRRGTQVEIALAGRGLADASEIIFEDGHLTAALLEGGDDARVQVRITIPADCPLGPHRLRVRTPRGLSELRTFRVGLFEQVAETEPNNAPAVAQAIAMPITIAGVVKADDIDCYRVRLPAGGRIAAAIDGIRLDQEMFDPHLELLDAAGTVLAACDDHLLIGPDAMLSATVPTEGDYVVRVRESVYGGNDGCVYLLHVGTFPIPHLAWPPVGRPGAALDVSWLGDPDGTFNGRAGLPAAVPVAGVAEIHAERAGVVSPVGVPIRVSSLSATPEAEPNDEPDRANPASMPAGLLGRMDRSEDVDWFRVTATKGEAVAVRGWARRLGSPTDLVINAHRDNDRRERITGNDDADGLDSEIRLTVPEQGSFLLRVSDHRRRGGDAFVYWLEVERALPGVTVSVPPTRAGSQERLVAAVPRGNRTAVVFNAMRSDVGGPLALGMAGLPAGVRATTGTATPAAPGIAVVLEADADAPLAAAYASATVLDGDRPLGGLRQVTELVGLNNTAYRTSIGERLPVAVTEAAPIRIEVEPPRVPLVQRGSMEVRVRIERLQDFNGRVKLAFPFKPPGIGAAANVDVPEGATEVVYPVSANANAPPGEWQVVVTGFVKPKGRDRDEDAAVVSSRPFPIRVGPPLVELAAEKAVVEQGRQVDLAWKVTKQAAFTGVAKARLLGLPARTDAPERDLAADAVELVFPVTVAADAPPGVHANVFCQIRVPMGDDWVTHAMPATQLRIDRPLARPKPEAKP